MAKREPNRFEYDINLERWFIRASAFHHASVILPIPESFAPSIVCSSLASEQYLKTLRAVEGGRPLWTHSLVDLFLDLSDESRDRLDADWTEKMGPAHAAHVAAVKANPVLGEMLPPRTLLNTLTWANKAFEDWRYADGPRAQDGVVGQPFAAWGLPYNLRAEILRRRPEFKPPAESQFAVLDP